MKITSSQKIGQSLHVVEERTGGSLCAASGRTLDRIAREHYEMRIVLQQIAMDLCFDKSLSERVSSLTPKEILEHYGIEFEEE